jgi:hypothetical protein
VNNDIPAYLLLTLGTQFGTCPYLHPKYSHQTRIDWLNLIHRYKCSPSAPEIIHDIKVKYINKTEIKDLETQCYEVSEKLLEDLKTHCDAAWPSIQLQISGWLEQSTKGMYSVSFESSFLTACP